MQNNEFLLINNIIYQIYSISDFNTMKVTFLNLLKMLIPNTASSILMADNSDSNNLLCDPICVPDIYSETENKYLSLEDQDFSRWIMLSKQCILIRESELMSEDELIKTEIYQKCYKPFGVHYSMQLTIVYNSIFLGVISLYRRKEDGDFTNDEMFIMKAFSDHLNLRFYQSLSLHSSQNSNNTYSMVNLASTYHLTNREAEILQLIFEDMDTQDIAEKLCISGYTLKKHLQNLYRKFDVSNKWGLLKYRN
ncbi:helix-turn-helix transcriptional regulator [Clostridium butyricum]|uniref:helix-turn-helix transcriptional regulator n=1 Tax=Clostridium butyricum TaxID=1492 RepID=UPI003D342B8A